MSLDLIMKVEKAIDDGRVSTLTSKTRSFNNKFLIDTESMSWGRNNMNGYSVSIYDKSKDGDKGRFLVSYNYDADINKIENVNASSPLFEQLIENGNIDGVKDTFSFFEKKNVDLDLSENQKREILECCIVNNQVQIAEFLINEKDYKCGGFVEFIKEYEVDDKFYKVFDIEPQLSLFENFKGSEVATYDEVRDISRKINNMKEFINYNELLNFTTNLSENINLYLRDGNKDNKINLDKIDILDNLNVDPFFKGVVRFHLKNDYDTNLEHEKLRYLVDKSMIDTVMIFSNDHNILAIFQKNNDVSEIKVVNIESGEHLKTNGISGKLTPNEVVNFIKEQDGDFKISTKNNRIFKDIMEEQKNVSILTNCAIDLAINAVNPNHKYESILNPKYVNEVLFKGFSGIDEKYGNVSVDFVNKRIANRIMETLESKADYIKENKVTNELLSEAIKTKFPKEISEKVVIKTDIEIDKVKQLLKNGIEYERLGL